MAWDWLGDAIGGAFDFVGDIFNFGQEKENLEWQKKAQKTAWAREDTAVQRRKEDLIAAGLSPVLAAGQPAQSMGPIQTKAPQLNTDFQGKIAMALGAMKAKADISQTGVQTQIAKEEAFRRGIENQGLRDLDARGIQLKDPMGTDNVYGLKDYLWRLSAKKLLNESDLMDYAKDTARANMNSAIINAANINRAYQYDVENQLYGSEAREGQALSTWLNQAGLSDLSGPAASALGNLLFQIMEKRVPGVKAR